MVAKKDRYKGLKSLGDMLSVVTKPILGKKGFVETDIIMKWKEIVGLELSEVTRPQKIVFGKNRRDNGVLYILAKGGGEALLLQHKEKMVIDKINTFFGYRAVARINIIQGFFDVKNDSIDDNIESLEEVDDQTVNLKARSLAKDIENDELAQALERLGQSVLKKQD